MGVCVDVMLCVGGWCLDYLQICAGYPSVASFEELSANSAHLNTVWIHNQGETPHVPASDTSLPVEDHLQAELRVEFLERT